MRALPRYFARKRTTLSKFLDPPLYIITLLYCRSGRAPGRRQGLRGSSLVRSRYGSWCRRGTLYARGAVEVRSWYGRGTLVVRSWCGRGTLVVRSRYARGTVESTHVVRSRYARGALPVRCGSLTFQRAILYLFITTPSSHTHRFHPLPLATPTCSPHPLATPIHSTHSPQ